MIKRHDASPDIAVVSWSNPPVNALNLLTRRTIRDDLETVLGDETVSGIVLAGGGRTFSGGADIREFGTSDASVAPNIVDLGRLMDTAQKPIVAAIAGVALGGGLEVALASQHPTSSSDCPR